LLSKNVAASRKGAMLRIDMSEFMKKHSVARLIGAPPAMSAQISSASPAWTARRTISIQPG
jgi:ATP-dependent Clp protease ATP-binding subunit ClpB